MPVEGTNLRDINIDLFRSFYERRTHEKLEDHDIPLENLMSNLKLMADDKLTLAGLLVFGKKPEEKRPQFVIKAVLFPGNSPAVSEYKDSRDISGNIPKIFEAGRSFLINNLRWVQKDQHFNTTGIQRIMHECKNAGITVDFIEEKENEQFKVIFHRN